MWDLGGQTSIRPYWRCYYPNTDAIIFVVDSCDVDRLGNYFLKNNSYQYIKQQYLRVGIAKQELNAMLEEEELKDATLLVFANKQDSKGALNSRHVSKIC